MNSPSHSQALTPLLAEDPPVESPTRKPISAAVWLRWLGSFAVVSSAVVYMLEGLHASADELRNWVYLLVMVFMAAGGVVSGKLLRDSKGARVFFGLAMLLVPVQFSQLAGQIHDGMVQAGGGAELFNWLSATLSALSLPLLATVACAAPIVYAGSAVLARNDKALVGWSVLMLSAALLLPARDSLLGYLVLTALVCATGWLKVKLYDRQSTYKNLDGIGLAVIVGAPLIIAFFRLLTHIDSTVGIAAIMGLLAFAMTRPSILGPQNAWPRFVGAITGILSWWVYLSNGSLFEAPHVSLYFWPVAIWLMDIARLAGPTGKDYRTTAMGFLIASAVSFLLSNTIVGANFYALGHGLIALTWGLLNNQREPTLLGAPLALVSTIAIAADAFSGIQVNGWVALGALGIVLVFGASLVERYGANWKTRTRSAWQTVNEWKEPV